MPHYNLQVSELNVELSEDQSPPRESFVKQMSQMSGQDILGGSRQGSQLSNSKCSYLDTAGRRGSGLSYQFSVTDCNNGENEGNDESVYR